MMARTTMRGFAHAVISLALMLVPVPALAGAEPSPSDRETARVLADKGAELFDAGKYEDAIDYFKKADGLVHAPTFVLMIAQSNAKLGRLKEARNHYQKVLDWPLTKQAPPRFAEAQKTARAEVDDLNRRIPTVELKLTAEASASTEGAQVEIDGEAVSDISAPIPLDPGEHTISVQPKSGAPIKKTITLSESTGEHLEFTITASTKPGTDAQKGSLLPAIIAFGVGAAGFGVGGVTGIMALSQIGDIKDQCTGNVCPKSLEGDANSAGTLADISTVGFIVGGVGAAAGIVLLVLRPGGGSAPENSSAKLRSPGFFSPEQVKLSVGPASLSLSGRF